MSESVRSANLLRIRRITATGIFAAMIYVLTAYLHIPTGAGYTHAGDGIIYLAASILPTPYAAAAGAIGGGLADGLSGFFIWLPGTIVIKAVTSLFFTNKGEKILNLRNILAIIPSLILCVVGYSLYEGIVMAKGFSWTAIAAAFGQTPAYCVQVFASALLFVSVSLLLDKVGFKKKFKF